MSFEIYQFRGKILQLHKDDFNKTFLFTGTVFNKSDMLNAENPLQKQVAIEGQKSIELR